MATERQNKLLTQLLNVCLKTQPGKAIPPQDELAKRFAASRTSIREAMVVLEFMQIIKVRPKIGSVVNPAHAWYEVSEEFLLARDEAKAAWTPKAAETISEGGERAA